MSGSTHNRDQEEEFKVTSTTSCLLLSHQFPNESRRTLYIVAYSRGRERGKGENEERNDG